MFQALTGILTQMFYVNSILCFIKEEDFYSLFIIMIMLIRKYLPSVHF